MSGPTAAHHESSHRRADKHLAGGPQPLVVFAHAPVLGKPREGALHDQRFGKTSKPRRGNTGKPTALRLPIGSGANFAKISLHGALVYYIELCNEFNFPATYAPTAASEHLVLHHSNDLLCSLCSSCSSSSSLFNIASRSSQSFTRLAGDPL